MSKILWHLVFSLILFSGITFQSVYAHGNLDQDTVTCPCDPEDSGTISQFPFVTRYQEFVPSKDNIVSIDVELFELDIPGVVPPILIHLRNGGPTGTIITSTTNNELPVMQGVVHFDFGERINLIPGNLYTIQLLSNDVGHTFEWHGESGNPYALGKSSFLTTNLGLRETPSDIDFTLKTYAQDIDEVKVIGGKIMPIENTFLLLAGTQTFSWIIPVVISIIGIGLVLVKRK